MATKRTHYEVLGLSRNATLVQIKRKYRQMVRKYHPDVANDKELAHKLFLQINEAYQTLSDPASRRAYDAALEHLTRSKTATATASQASGVPAASVDKHIKDAQWAFIQRRFQDAASHCKEAIKADGQNAYAHVILGDVYRAQGKYNSAIRAYSNALQFSPNDHETEKKLSQVVAKQLTAERKKKHTEEKQHTKQISYDRKPSHAAFNMIWWTVAVFLIMLIGAYPGKPIAWLSVYIPQISGWSWNLVGLMFGASVVAGMSLSVNGLLSHPDNELLFENGSVSAGLILLIGSGFFFLGSAVLYTLISLIQGTLSKSVMTVFACAMAVVLFAAMNYDPVVRKQVLLFGGNVTFLSCLIGWYIGSMLRPLGEY